MTLRIVISFGVALSAFSSLFCEAPSSHIQLDETPTAKYLEEIFLDELHSGLKGIDCIYVINLDARPDKWERTKRLLNQYGLKVNRIKAVDGWNLNEDAIREMSGPYPIAHAPGHYGCLLSHLSIIKDAMNRGFDRIWVCEDDIEILEDVHQIPPILQKLDNIDPSWDIFFTDIRPRIPVEGQIIHYYHPSLYNPQPGGIHYPQKYYEKTFQADPEITRIFQRSGGTSYILSKYGMKKMFTYFTHIFFWAPWDIEVHFTPSIKEYIPNRDIVSNLPSFESDTSFFIDKSDEIPENFFYHPPKTISLKEEYSDLFKKRRDRALITYQNMKNQEPSESAPPLLFWNRYILTLLEEIMGSIPPKKMLSTYSRLHEFLPSRAEPIYWLTRYHRIHGNFEDAFQWAEKGENLDPPSDTDLFEEWIYSWGMKLEYALICFHLEKYGESKKKLESILLQTNLPNELQLFMEGITKTLLDRLSQEGT